MTQPQKDGQPSADLKLLLAPLRARIDALDRQVLAQLNERARVAIEIGEIKKAVGAAVLHPEREQQVIQNLQLANPGPLSGDNLIAIWREIMSASRALEKRETIAFLGPAGTYSEQAALAYFGHAVERMPCASFDDVFHAVESGSARFGVVPVENSTEGSIGRTLDLLLHTPLLICGEIAAPIHHNLLTRSGSMLGITSIRAHAQALGQCQQWLTKHHPTIERMAVASNAEAAKIAGNDASVAAIAGDAAALTYALQVVYANIQDDTHNRTRFVVIGHQACKPGSRDQTSLILSVPNEAGAIYRLLAPLAEHGVSMSRIESRPAHSGTWEYYFFIDIEGHQDDPPVAAALAALRGKSAFYKMLGSYPCSV